MDHSKSVETFDTNVVFSGGAGMFIQYHDIVKATYLTAIIKLMMSKKTYGLPLDIIRHMSIVSLVEWYVNRRYQNPLRVLDYQNQVEPAELDKLMKKIFQEDPSIYKYAPVLNINRLLSVYTRQHMNFPVYIYTKEEDENAAKDVETLFPGVPTTYLYGDLTKALARCDQNFTYMVSDFDLLLQLVELLNGTCSHLLIACDYRYNCKPDGTLTYDLDEIAGKHPFLRIEPTFACTPTDLVASLKELSDKFTK